ncbi:MAG: CvpA family protein [Planctomycetota bacterium]|jgi:hypothetical protein|nr:CvpA family protein [Planctomycetota bacterium]
MDGVENWLSGVAAIDIIAVALMLMGVAMGLMRGLGPAFGMLLWLMVSLWLARTLTPTVLGWMPNSPIDTSSQLSAFGLIAGLLLVLPALARLLGGAGGKKKEDPAAQHRGFGVLVGIACAGILFTLLAPYANRMQWVSSTFGRGAFPVMAEQVSDGASWFFPAAHREALKQAGVGSERQAGASDQR